jgi:hypothetical protein
MTAASSNLFFVRKIYSESLIGEKNLRPLGGVEAETPK